MTSKETFMDRKKLTYEVKDVVLDDMANLNAATLQAVLEDFENRITIIEASTVFD